MTTANTILRLLLDLLIICQIDKRLLLIKKLIWVSKFTLYPIHFRKLAFEGTCFLRDDR